MDGLYYIILACVTGLLFIKILCDKEAHDEQG